MREIRINNPETGAIGTMKKENRKMAQQRRAEERRKKEFRRKLSKILAIGIPILVVIILVVVLVVYSNKTSDNTGSSDNTTASSSSDTGSTTDNGTENSYSTDTSLTVEDGDTVNIDYVGTVDGVEFDGGSTEGMGTDLVIGSGSYIDDFEEQLIGAHPGETVEVNVTFPDDYYSTDMAGKDAVFTVTDSAIFENIFRKQTFPYEPGIFPKTTKYISSPALNLRVRRTDLKFE